MTNARNYYIATTIAVLLWSASFIATKIAYTAFSPLMVCLIRFLGATILMFFIRKFTHDTAILSKKELFSIGLSGLFGITLYFACENIGVQLTTASNASLIVASYPALTVLLEFFFFHAKPTLKKCIGIAFAVIGVVILTAIQPTADSKDIFRGNMILIAAGIIWAIYNFITRTLTTEYSPLTLSYYQTLIGTILFTPLILLEAPQIHTVTISNIGALIYLSAGCSVAAFLLYNYGLRGLSAATSVAIMNLVPVFGLIFSALILHETITLRQILGGLIVISGVVLSSDEKNK